MHNKIYLLACFISLFFLRESGADTHQFINEKNGFVVVEQIEGKIFFHDPILEDEMRESGVVIPIQHQARYEGCERIRLGEKGFFEAFREFYSIYIYDSEVYAWRSL
ncbi:MAG: hypothetical protein FJZ59_00995 [Chlamydiae bacterium]|nr:hypothetical protein [Chlamydiota bacterium]